MKLNKRLKWTLWVLFFGILLFYLKIFGMYFTSVFVTSAIFAIYAVTLNLLMGFTGLFSFGHAMFFGTGAYATAIALNRNPGQFHYAKCANQQIPQSYFKNIHISGKKSPRFHLGDFQPLCTVLSTWNALWGLIRSGSSAMI